MEEWSNNACLGYVIAGLRSIGKDSMEIQEIISAVYRQFDMTSVDEAKEIYNKSPY